LAFTFTHGYAAMWIVTAGAILASIPVLGALDTQVSHPHRHTSSPETVRS
jgi:hypothetical protein